MLKNRLKVFALSAVFLATASVLPVARAATFGFDAITSNDVADIPVGESQLFVDVTDPGGGQVLFTFRNTGPDASSITDVYFDDRTPSNLTGIASIINGTGVSFSQGASPSNLSGANNVSPAFVTTTDFLADSDSGPPGVQANGVNPGETLGLLFNLVSGMTVDDVVAALIDGLDLRIGIHVQSFASGQSESFINDPSPVPLPAALPLFLTMLGGIGLLRWKRRRAVAA
jgi:hypothetical protein